MLALASAPRVLVLGDMGEVGSEGRKFHEEIGAYARGRGIDHLLTLGELAGSASNAFGARARHYDSVEALNDAVKGSRFMRMERVVQRLAVDAVQEAH